MEKKSYHGQAKSLKTLTLMCLAGFLGVDIVKEGADWAQIASIKKIGCTKLSGEKDIDKRGSATICKLGCCDFSCDGRCEKSEEKQ